MQEVDILENDILVKYPNVLQKLLFDHTTQKNIFWATHNYEERGINYRFSKQILPQFITGKNGDVIMPRVKKDKDLQQLRVRDMAEKYIHNH